MPQKPLPRFLVCALHHEAKARGIPMTHLAQQLVEDGLRGTQGWHKAKAQLDTMQVGEGVTEYRTK